MAHYKASFNHHSSDCFCYFDSSEKMFEWLTNKSGEHIASFSDIAKWNKKQHKGVAHAHGVIDFDYIPDIVEFYMNRKAYVDAVRICEILLYKSQKTGDKVRRSRFLDKYGAVYEFANYLCDEYPEVWCGEI